MPEITDPYYKKSVDLTAQAEAETNPIQKDALLAQAKHYLDLYKAGNQASGPKVQTINGKPYQEQPDGSLAPVNLDSSGNPIATPRPAVVPRGGTPIVGTNPDGTPIYGQQTSFSVPSGGSIVTPGPDGTPTITRAPLSTADQLKTQIEYWDAQVKQGKLAPDAAKAQLDDWITRNISIPKEASGAAQSLATATEAGDISAANTSSNLRSAAIKDSLSLMPYRGFSNAAAAGVAGMFRKAGMDMPDDAFRVDLTQPVGANNAQFLKAMSGVSPYAAYLANAKAQLNMPDNTQTGTPPPTVPAATIPTLPALTDQQRAAMANVPYQVAAANDYLRSRGAALGVG